MWMIGRCIGRVNVASVADGSSKADVLVIFGITGDLAKVMTFRSLYRLERRGLLDCPIVGVAVDDWSVDQLIQRARDSIVGTGEQLDEAVFERLAKRFSYVQGDFGDDGDVRARQSGDRPTRRARSSTSRSRRSCSAGSSPASPARALRRMGVSSSRSRSATTSTSARELADELHQSIDESQLYRIDHYLGKMGLDEILLLRFSNTVFEPVWNRNHIAFVQITMAEDFGVEDRGHFYDPVGALRDVVVNHLMQVVAATAMEAPSRGEPANDQGRAGGALPLRRRGAIRPTTCAGSTTATSRSTASQTDRRPRRTPRCGSRSRTGAGPAFPSSSAPASACRRRRPRCESSSSIRRSSASASPRPSRIRSWSSSTRPPGSGSWSARAVPTRRASPRSNSTWSSRRRAARGRPRTRCCSTPRWSATARASPARTGSRSNGGSCSRCSTPRRRCTPTRRVAGGRTRPTSLVEGHGRWHEPWIVA